MHLRPLAVATLAAFQAFALSAATIGPVGEKTLLSRHCTGCHNNQVKSGGLNLTALDSAHPEKNAREWESVILKVRSGMMPPAGAPRPAPASLKQLVTALESRLDVHSAANPDPGRPPLHRLNRTEYANSIRDLLSLEINVDSLLPADDMTRGFDNMAEVLNVSPTLIDAYIRAAGKISRIAVGDRSASPVVETYHLPSTLSQTRHIPGTPYGTRGGTVLRHHFPLDGDYSFRLSLYFTTNTFLFGVHQPGEKIEISINGQRVALLDVNHAMKVDEDLRTPPIRVKAGPQNVSVAFVERAAGPVDDFIQPFEHSLGDLFLGRTQGLTGLPHLRDVGIEGPRQASGPGDTPSRNRIFTCRPEDDSSQIACAKKILSQLATLAYRRPISDSDREDLLTAFQRGSNAGGFEAGIQQGLQRILASPQFVFRFERTPPGTPAGTNYRIDGLELASRLSYFLWSSAPDDQLLNLGKKQSLKQPQILETELRRLIADPRTDALATNFAGQWLALRNLRDSQPDLFLFPNANRNLLDSMRRETELLFHHIVRQDRPVLDLLSADYTFVDETLARHYGLPNVSGNHFRKVAVTDENRRGVLGHASVLTLTSFANRTSPVVRGKWVLDTILGAPPPRPPADVPPLNENSASHKLRSVRERLEEHRSNPACASCHRIMDPVGFALESFDATGAFRTRDSGFPIETQGNLTDGSPVNGPASLRKALEARSDAFLTNFAERLLTYALGRGLQPQDMPAVRAVVREAGKHEYRFSAFVRGVVQSTPFQMRKAEQAKRLNHAD